MMECLDMKSDWKVQANVARDALGMVGVVWMFYLNGMI